MSNTQDFIQQLLSVTVPQPNLQLPDPTLLQYYDDFSNRVYWVTGEIDGDVLELVNKIIFWNREDQALPIDQRKPIKIFFNSVGGSLDVAETLVSIIRLSKTPVYGIAIGMVASAASLIYLSCQKRLAFKNAYFIFHQGSCENLGGNFDEIQAAMEDYRAQVNKMKNFYIESTTFPEEVVNQKIKSDWYIRGEELIENGVVNQWVVTINDLL